MKSVKSISDPFSMNIIPPHFSPFTLEFARERALTCLCNAISWT